MSGIVRLESQWAVSVLCSRARHLHECCSGGKSSVKREHLHQFGQHTAAMVTRALDAQWGCFYLLDAAMNTHSFAPYGAPAGLRQAYVEQNLELEDPLHPRFLTAPPRRFTTVMRPAPSSESVHARYWKVMRDFGVQRAGELIFLDGNRPIGGISIIWRNDTHCASLDRAFVIRSYVEFNLIQALRDEAVEAPHEDVIAALGLSARERDVAALVCRGCTNIQIATELGISFATVKTHLLHIFAKADVANRTSLIARLMRKN